MIVLGIALLTALVVINAAALVIIIGHMADSKPERHTYSTIACMEDAIAVILDSEFEMSALQARLTKARQILGAGRTSPHSYDPDQPAGRRPKGMDR